MNALSILRSTHQLLGTIAPDMPQEVRLLADQLSGQTEQPLGNFAYYGLLVACLVAALALLFSSLLLVLYHPPMKPVQPEIRLIKFAEANRQPKRPVESCVARANRDQLRIGSAQIRAGQLSN